MTLRSTLAAKEDSKEDQEIYKLVRKMYDLGNKQRLLKGLQRLYDEEIKEQLRGDHSEKPEAPK